MRTKGGNDDPKEAADLEGIFPHSSHGRIRVVSSRVYQRREAKAEAPKDRYWRYRRELRAAGGFLEHEFPGQNVWLIAERHFEEERTARDFFREFKRTFGQQQKRDEYPRWHFEVLEPACNVHSNLIGPLTLARAEQLLNYKFEGVAYGEFIEVRQILPSAGGMRGLIGDGMKNRGYLGKELGGKHVLGEGGGDKIRFSDAYRAELIGRGLIEDRQRDYASRALSHAKPKKRPPQAAATAPKPVLKIVVNNALAPGELQLSLLAEKPVTRLRDYAHGIMPRAVAYEVETRRKWLGLTQAALADAIRVSRSQLVNVLKSRFPLSEWGAARLRDFLLKGEKLAA